MLYVLVMEPPKNNPLFGAKKPADLSALSKTPSKNTTAPPSDSSSQSAAFTQSPAGSQNFSSISGMGGPSSKNSASSANAQSTASIPMNTLKFIKTKSLGIGLAVISIVGAEHLARNPEILKEIPYEIPSLLMIPLVIVLLGGVYSMVSNQIETERIIKLTKPARVVSFAIQITLFAALWACIISTTIFLYSDSSAPGTKKASEARATQIVKAKQGYFSAKNKQLAAITTACSPKVADKFKARFSDQEARASKAAYASGWQSIGKDMLEKSETVINVC